MSEAPYTGTSSEAVAPGPRIRWGRIALVHFAAAFVAGFAFPVVGTAFDPQWILIGIMSGFFVSIIGGGVTLGLAALGVYVATRGGRGWGRETLGAAIGSFAGAAAIGAVLFVLVGTFGLILFGIAGLGTAIGIGIWILVAWAPHLQDRPVR
jgi:hypothetical protein